MSAEVLRLALVPIKTTRKGGRDNTGYSLPCSAYPVLRCSRFNWLELLGLGYLAWVTRLEYPARAT
jgi:hypothetical protein